MFKFLVIAGILVASTVIVKGNDGLDFNHGLHVVGKVVRQFINAHAEDFKLADGIHIISTASPNDATGRSAEDTSALGVLQNYLQSHELRIKLSELMPDGRDFGRALKDVSGSDISDIGTGRGKNKGGGGGALLLLGSLFASTLGALGLGGVGLLAMKALTVSAMALLLAAVVGVKKLASSHDDGGGHHVIHASSGHGYEHRRKREAGNIAYRAWSPYTLS